jgi:peptidoglycan biosynthesis protein MviN/MurJ (putative lipid II flippase)
VASLIPYLAVMFVVLGLAPVLVFGMLTLERKAALLGILTAELVANAALCAWLAPALGVRGIALATTVAMLASNAALWTLLVRRIRGFDPRAIAARAARTAAVCAAAGVALAAAHRALWQAAGVDGALGILVACAVLGVPFLALYAALCHAAGLVEIRFAGGRPHVRVTGEA